jgi:hypothetical protein
MHILKIAFLLTVSLISTLQAGDDTPTDMVKIWIEDLHGNGDAVEIFVPAEGTFQSFYDAYSTTKNLSPNDEVKLIFAGKLLPKDQKYTKRDVGYRSNLSCNILARITHAPLY